MKGITLSHHLRKRIQWQLSVIEVRECYGATGFLNILKLVMECVPIGETAPPYFIEPVSDARSSQDLEKHRPPCSKALFTLDGRVRKWGHHGLLWWAVWLNAYFPLKFVYGTGDHWASGVALVTKATKMKEGTTLSSPSAGSQSAAESTGGND